MLLNESIGFEKNPFSKKSAEQEYVFLDEIFFEPNYYQTLKSVLAEGDSRFIVGQRGHGKSSLVNKLLEDLENQNQFVIKLDRFDSIPIRRNESALILLILKEITTKFAVYLAKNPGVVRRLDRFEKEKLALFIRWFFIDLSPSEYEKVYDSVQRVKINNLLRRCWNRLVFPANLITSSAIAVTSTLIRQSLGLPDVEGGVVYREYLGKLNEIDFRKVESMSALEKDDMKRFLDDLLNIIRKVGFGGTVVLFDKLDEYQALGQDINKISEFAQGILSDTELLLNERFAIGFSLWSELKNSLEGKVRFDKFGIVDVRWSNSDLVPLINKRIRYYSVNNDLSLEKLINASDERQEVIQVANKSPRDLISVLSQIYACQENHNSTVKTFDSMSVSKGIEVFCRNYDYESMIPSNSGRNKEVKSMINRLLQLRLSHFNLTQMSKSLDQNSSQSEGQVKTMIKYRLIREDDIKGQSGERVFEVVDPKVNYLIRRGITRIE